MKLENNIYELIAMTCHGVYKVYCESLGDLSKVNWEETADYVKEDTIARVKFIHANPNMTPKQIHEKHNVFLLFLKFFILLLA